MPRTIQPKLRRSRILFSSLALAGIALAACGTDAAQAEGRENGLATELAPGEEPLSASAEASVSAAAQDPGTTWTQDKLEQTSREIQKDVETLRGVKFDADVPVKLATKEQFVAYALERTERMEPALKRSGDEMVLKMLGLIPAEMDLLEETLRLLKDQVGGFYDPGTKTFYLMQNCPEGIAKVVLAHELGHALDDQLYDLDGSLAKVSERTDMALAYQAVVEGSGTAVMNRWTVNNIKSIDMSGLTSMQEEQTASMARSPMVLWKPLMGAYLKGAAFLARTESVLIGQTKTATNADLDQAFRSPPTSTEQILHPAKYWDLAQRDEPMAVEQANEALPEGWQRLRADIFGELAIAIWTISPGERSRFDPAVFSNPLNIAYTNSAAQGWGGDQLVLIGKDEGARALRWVSVWDTERDAAEFFGAASVLVPELETQLGALSKLAGGEARHVSAAVRYGADTEVIIELAFGVKASEIKKVFKAFGER